MESHFNGMFSQVTSTQLIVDLCAVVVFGIAVSAFITLRRTQTRKLRNHFGSEYDRAIVIHGSSRQAEVKLADRESRVEALNIHELGTVERDRFISEWHTVQSRFVDFPKPAVAEADGLVNALLEARGYPRASFEQRAADVSVNYPRIIEKYRLAHAIAARTGGSAATTEELRNAMIQYRSIFDELAAVQLRGPGRSSAVA